MRVLVASVALLLAIACAQNPPAASGTSASSSGNGPQGASSSTMVNTGTGKPPCNVDAILASRCQACHASEPIYGAPMPLVTAADFTAPSVTRPGETVAQRVSARIHDGNAPMPSSGMLPQAELDVLDAWLASGTPAGTEASCGSASSSSSGAPGVGPEFLPCDEPTFFRAHAPETIDKFHVPEDAGNLYQCFSFATPFGSTEEAVAWAPVIDDERVVHHWILYRTRIPQEDGAVGPCNMPNDAIFVTGWAPGGGNFAMPDDVSLELGGANTWYILQLHYHNAAGLSDAFDRSGVALCTTPTPRAQSAGVITLGTGDIFIPRHATATATTTCTNPLETPVHILTSGPHMHQLGTHISTTILRAAGGAPETLVDVPHWDFNTQATYRHDPPVRVTQGDRLVTTCEYNNPTDRDVTFGEKTEDEMCFNFIVVYPITIIPEDARVCAD